jgi:lipid-binding SYLF domain-containing protein
MPDKENSCFQRGVVMQEVTMTVKVPIEVRDAFMARVNEEKRPVKHIIIDLMKAYAEQTSQQLVSNTNYYLSDDLVARAKKGQAAILEATLKDGFPLTYRDKQGNLMQKNPDGTITLLEKAGE